MIARPLLAVVVTFFIAASTNAELIHRYSFSDGGKDSVGKVDANLKGSAKAEGGKLVLENGDKTSTDPTLSYVEFSASVLPKSGSATLMIWFTAKETQPFARLLNIGDQEAGEGRSFLYITARTADDMSRIGITPGTVDERIPLDNRRLDDGQLHVVAMVIDATNRKFRMYIDGKEPSAAVDLGEAGVDKIKPVQNWIGRSSFDNDGGLTASVDEFRVYDHALSAEEIAAVHKAGADKLPEK
jgi:hypothetical protein